MANELQSRAGDSGLPAKGEVGSGDVRGLPSCEDEAAVRLPWVAADGAWPALGLSTMSAALRRSSKGLPLLAGLLACCNCTLTGLSHEVPNACDICKC